MEIGQWNTFEVLKRVDFGAYLEGEELGEILLPIRELLFDCQAGDHVEAFLYNDSEDRLIATTRKPLARVGDLVLLRVVDVNPVGAFLDWGLPKDLLVPRGEQQEPMQRGRTYLVYVALDRSGRRIFASSKLNRFFPSRQVDCQEGDQVDLVIAGKSDIGYKAVVNMTSLGLLYEDEVFGELETGRRMQGYVKCLRPDGKIDLSLHKPGYDKVLEAKENIMSILNKSGGTLAVTDKSPPDHIRELFGISKKTYKQAVGALYRARRIRLEADCIFLNREDEQ
ncbi:MAG: GntR family transcriptional regulator [Desulfohalobiaceae bacterium]|nr:GntR family transcriptional regulator [Desulfohalobiaceae bacterium]